MVVATKAVIILIVEQAIIMEDTKDKKQYPITPEIAEAQPKEVQAKGFLKAWLMHNLLDKKENAVKNDEKE